MHMWQNTAQGEIGQSQAKKREKKDGGPDKKTRYGLHAYIAIEPSALSDTRAILCRKAGTSWDRPSNGHGKKDKTPPPKHTMEGVRGRHQWEYTVTARHWFPADGLFAENEWGGSYCKTWKKPEAKHPPVGTSVGAAVGAAVGSWVGAAVGWVGAGVG
jgi:hypothetical protein